MSMTRFHYTGLKISVNTIIRPKTVFRNDKETITVTICNTSWPLVPLQLVVFLFTNDRYFYISFIRGRKVGLLSAKSNGAGKAPVKTSIKGQTSCKSGQEHKPSSAGLPKL